MRDGVLVGRLDELAEYERALEMLRAGHGGTIALIGEPGAGKTRLVAALVGAARAAGVATLIVRTPVHSGDGHSLTEALAQARATTGVTIFVDDVHGIAADSAAQLDALVHLAVVHPVLVVIAYRPRQVGCEVGAVLSRAEASGASRHVVLGPLGRAESAILLAGHDDAVRIHADGGGNPLYMKLLAGEVAEPTGGLVREVAELGRQPPPPGLPEAGSAEPNGVGPANGGLRPSDSGGLTFTDANGGPAFRGPAIGGLRA